MIAQSNFRTLRVSVRENLGQGQLVMLETNNARDC